MTDRLDEIRGRVDNDKAVSASGRPTSTYYPAYAREDIAYLLAEVDRLRQIEAAWAQEHPDDT